MGRRAVRFLLLNKRLFKKYSFLLVLCLVPLLVGGMRLMAREESGIAKIAFYLPETAGKWAENTVETMILEEPALEYIRCESEEAARGMVEAYEADTAWIFPKKLEERIREGAAFRGVKPLITVVEREESVLLLLPREILSSHLYTLFSYEVYRNFVREDLQIADTAEEELREIYERTLVEGGLFRREYLNGEAVEDGEYLMSPIRGLLSLWFVLCGLTGTVFYLQDAQRGVYDRIPVRKRLWRAFEMQAAVLSSGGVVLLLGCGIAGVFTFWYREIINVLLFGCSTAVFCTLLGLLAKTPQRLGLCLPLLFPAMMVLCPIFLSIKGLRGVKLLLPPFYYLNGIRNGNYLYGMIIYGAVGLLLCVLLVNYQKE